MKKVLFSLFFLFVFIGHAFAFTPNPIQYEYIGRIKGDVGVFYEIKTAKADGQKGIVTILYADPKNRIIRYYYDVVIDGENKQWTGGKVGIFGYTNQSTALDSFNLPNKATSYKEKDTYDLIYKDLLAKEIIVKPQVYVPPVKYVYIAPEEPWQIAASGEMEAEEILGDDMGEPSFTL